MIVLAELGLPLMVVAASFVLIGLTQTQTATHGSERSAGFWATLAHALGTTFGLTTKIAHFIVSHFAASQLRQLARWLQAMGTLSAGWFGVNAAFAEAIVQAVEHVMHRGDPRARAKASSAHRAAVHAGHAAHRADAHAGHVGKALGRYRSHTTPRVNHAVHAVDVAIPRDIRALRERNKALERTQVKEGGAIRELEHGATKTWEWIRSHPFSAATAAFAGAVAIALSRIGFGFFRCRSWQNLARTVTCRDAGLLSDFLALLTTVFGTVGLVEFARAEQKVIREVHTIVHDLWEL